MLYIFALVSVFLTTSSFKIPLQRWSNPSRRLGFVGNAAMNNYQNVRFPQIQYYANITVGTPGQALSALLDTGSSFSWVPSVTCDSSCYAPAYYNSSMSSSYKSLGILDGIEYNIGSTEGVIGTETFSIGTNSTVGATDVPFLLVTSEASIGSRFAGLLVTPIQGFGFAALHQDYPTFVDMLKSQGVISERVFSFYLSDNNFTDNDEDTESVCIIGEVDLTYTNNPVHYIPLYKQQGHWSVQLSAVTLGAFVVPLSVDIAILDTGTSILVAPEADYSSVIKALNAAGSCSANMFGETTCDCHTSYQLSSYPDIVIYLNNGKNNFTFTSSDYLWDVRDIQDGDSCTVLILGAGSDYPFWILGQPFLRKYYTIFDMDNARVGISNTSGGAFLSLVVLLFASTFL